MSMKAKNVEGEKTDVGCGVSPVYSLAWIFLGFNAFPKEEKRGKRKETQSAQRIPGLEYFWASIRLEFLQAHEQKKR